MGHSFSEGTLRASHRCISEPPYDNLGLPYHRSFEEDIAPLREGKPEALVLDLLPTSNIFNSGHRIRVTITCADADTMENNVKDPPPQVTVYRNRDFMSHAILPVIPSR